MVSSTTGSIEVRVQPEYKPEHSTPHSRGYVFAYHVCIINHGQLPIRMTRRQWFIADGPVIRREVSGEGLVGEYPEIPPGGRHEYSSYCPIVNPLGRMHGFFLGHLPSGENLRVEVPAFTLVAPFILS
ncbi:MAG: Co2+/Mg2+ efflux protein ApaG [Bacteroidota bacterium]